MNIFTAAAILQLLLIVRGSDVRGERKRVGCYYLGTTSERYGTFYPENIDASICTHVSYLHGSINNETHEINFRPPMRSMKTGGEGFVPRLVKLKSENPDLKLTLHILYSEVDWLSQEASRTKVIRSGVKGLNASGFDGLDIPAPLFGQEVMERMADFLCEMKNEFDKYGFLVTTSLAGTAEIPEEIISKLGRCCEYVALTTNFQLERITQRLSPMSRIKYNVDWYVERGLPPSKILVIVPSIGATYRLEDPNDTGLGAAINGPGNDDHEMMGGVGISYKELMRRINNSSLEWTIRRDNETKEPYAFSTTGVWMSYDDTSSMKYKARYVMEEGLGGLDVVPLDYDDDEGLGEEGRFPLTRMVYNTFIQGNQSDNASN